ncbi:MAG: hypothetical protein A2Z96_03105 [Spirochaetes bacterium GWB1_48_6]|nr:MAG: hypothetical protein A2Z96_03105 [Spirochaetes bacterium GWB1_48_6]
MSLNRKSKAYLTLCVESYCDKEKRQPRQRRTYIGRKDPVSGDDVKHPEIHDALEFGNIFLLKSITEQIGLTDDLKSVIPET